VSALFVFRVVLVTCITRASGGNGVHCQHGSIVLDFTNAPPGIKEYAVLVSNLTNEQLFERIAGWPDRSEAKLGPGDVIDIFQWSMRVEIEELRHRLGAWLAIENAVLPKYSGPNPVCPKCGANGKGDIKTGYHKGPEPGQGADTGSICWGRLEEGREHLHRMCKKCGYEWLEDCAQNSLA
jgi:hypothetical protein